MFLGSREVYFTFLLLFCLVFLELFFTMHICHFYKKNLEIVILSEVSQTEKDKYHMISLICEI